MSKVLSAKIQNALDDQRYTLALEFYKGQQLYIARYLGQRIAFGSTTKSAILNAMQFQINQISRGLL